LVMFAVRREILEALFRDLDWAAKMEEAKTGEKVEKVLVDFCRAKGYRVRRVEA